LDDDLDPLVAWERRPGYEKVNTLVKYRIGMPVEEGEEVYLSAYTAAGEVAELVLDALRLLRPREDVGVLAVEVVAADDLTPDIRKTWADRYQPDLARYYPTRFDFGPASPNPISDAEHEQLGVLVSRLLGKAGRSVSMLQARGRVRSSVERYAREDPERLLEYAIALEALYLDDISSERVELTYRLALRAARLLESDLGRRATCFKLVRDLYGFRSQIAHGTSMESVQRKKRRRLQEVLEEAPGLVSRSIRAILEKGPAATETAPAQYWQAVELG
jgi:hypothetical protein